MNTNQPNQPQAPTTPKPETINDPSFTQTPVQPQAPKKKKPWLLASIIVLLLSATGVLGFKYYELKQKMDNQQTTQSPSPQLIVSSPTPVTSPASETDPTEGWESYKSENFTFKYPPEWNIKSENNSIRIVSFDTNQKAEEIKPAVNREIFVSNHKNISDFESWLLENQAGKIIDSKTINKNKFLVISGGAMYGSREYAIEINNNNYLRFVLEPFTDNKSSNQLINTLEKALSTLTVLN